jgi:hypothetical protein
MKPSDFPLFELFIIEAPLQAMPSTPLCSGRRSGEPLGLLSTVPCASFHSGHSLPLSGRGTSYLRSRCTMFPLIAGWVIRPGGYLISHFRHRAAGCPFGAFLRALRDGESQMNAALRPASSVRGRDTLPTGIIQAWLHKLARPLGQRVLDEGALAESRGAIMALAGLALLSCQTVLLPSSPDRQTFARPVGRAAHRRRHFYRDQIRCIATIQAQHSCLLHL